jgi:hypothetical protein
VVQVEMSMYEAIATRFPNLSADVHLGTPCFLLRLDECGYAWTFGPHSSRAAPIFKGIVE